MLEVECLGSTIQIVAQQNFTAMTNCISRYYDSSLATVAHTQPCSCFPWSQGHLVSLSQNTTVHDVCCSVTLGNRRVAKLLPLQALIGIWESTAYYVYVWPVGRINSLQLTCLLCLRWHASRIIYHPNKILLENFEIAPEIQAAHISSDPESSNSDRYKLALRRVHSSRSVTSLCVPALPPLDQLAPPAPLSGAAWLYSKPYSA